MSGRLARVFSAILNSLRELSIALFGKISVLIFDEQGKPKHISPQSFGRVAVGSFVLIFGIFVLIRVLTPSSVSSKDWENFKKEADRDVGVSARSVSIGREDDPNSLRNAFLRGLPKEPLSAVEVDSDPKKSSMPDVPADGLGPINQVLCDTLIDELKAGKEMNDKEKSKVNECLDSKFVSNLTADQIKTLKMLNETPPGAIRDLLGRVARGEASEAEVAIAKRLGSMSAGEKAMLEKMLAADNKDELLKAFEKKLSGKASKDDLALLEGFRKEMGGTPDGSEVPSASSPDKEAALRDMAQYIAGKQLELRNLASKELDLLKAAKPAMKKDLEGKSTTPEEKKAQQDLAANRAEQQKLKEEIDKKNQEAGELAKSFQNTLATVAATIEKSNSGNNIQSGFNFTQLEPAVKCSEVKALPLKIKQELVAEAEKMDIKDSSGKKLSDKQKEFLKLYRKKMFEVVRAKNDLKDPLAGRFDNENATISDETKLPDIKAGIIEAAQSLKNFQLTPNIKIPAYIEGAIKVSNKNKNGIIVRAVLLADVHDSVTQSVIMNKGSVAIGKTAGFDEDTGVMNLEFSQVVAGSGRVVPIRLYAGSGDGSSGVMGHIEDNQGNYLLGTFVTSFSAGILSAFSQSVIQPLQTSTNLTNLALGATGMGASDTMNKISELEAAKLQNAAKIWHLPGANFPVVLYPE